MDSIISRVNKTRLYLEVGMDQGKVRVTVEGYGDIYVEKGSLLGRALEGLGLVSLPCRGQGLCGLCRVEVLSDGLSSPTERERIVLGRELPRVRLACQARVTGYTRIRVPEQKPGVRLEKKFMLPRLRRLYPIIEILDLKPGEKPVDVDLIVSSGLHEGRRYAVTYGKQMINSTDKRPDNMLLVDMGTTTLTMIKVGLDGKARSSLVMLNPLYKYGLDIVSRGEKASEDQRVALEMKRTIIETFLRIADQGTALVLAAGNTINTYLAAGLPVESLVEYPYQPPVRGSILVPVNPPVILAPTIAGQVGGDMLMNLLATQHMRVKKPYMVIDIGTNAEIALVTEDEVLVSSAPAGPAIEGYVGRGSWGGRGGVYMVEVGSTDKPVFRVHGDPRRGFMGSGILSLVYGLYVNGFIDRSGRFVRGYEIIGGVKAFVIDRMNNLYFTQKDLREVQKALAAIKAGWKIVLEESGLSPNELSRVIITGRPVQSLGRDIVSGLGLSPARRTKIMANLVPYGLHLYAFSARYRGLARRLIGMTRHIVLAGSRYADKWVSSLRLGPG